MALLLSLFDLRQSLLIDGNRVEAEKVLSMRLGEPTAARDATAAAAGEWREDDDDDGAS